MNIQTGDLYNDGTYQGKVIEVSNDTITIESQNDDGEVVNIQIPIGDSADVVKEWDQLSSKLWNGEKVSKPEYWTDEDWTDFVAAVEDFDLSDDNPEGTVLKQDGYTAWLETPGLEPELDDDYYEGLEDEISDSCYAVYDKKGKELERFSSKEAAEDYADNFTVRDEQVEIRKVADSKKDQFFMDLLLNHKATCPKTGKWEIKGLDLYNKGKKLGTLPKSVEKAVDFIEAKMNKITDASGMGYVDDKYIDELLDYGETTIPLNGKDPDTIYFDVDFIVQGYAKPDLEVETDYELLDDKIRIFIK